MPANVILRVDGSLNVINGEGSAICTAAEALEALDYKIMPTFKIAETPRKCLTQTPRTATATARSTIRTLWCFSDLFQVRHNRYITKTDPSA